MGNPARAHNSEVTAPGRPFQPGQSGNPGGRPKGIAAKARELVGDDPQRLLSVFLEVAEDTSAKTADRLNAAEKFLDRAWGKSAAFAPVEGGDPLDGLTERVDRVLDELAEKRQTQASRKG